MEDLMNVEVTSVSMAAEKLSGTAAAVFVITQEEIGRSGATNIPDLLRIVPGMDVAQIDANTWAISSRGFNARFTKELDVLVDGRSVYTVSFGGVFWDVLDLPLEDIERIEVIRGHGGSVWGGNAVNGVINIITKKASQTRGVSVSGGGGTIGRGFGRLQYGGSLRKATDYRIFVKYFNEGHRPDPKGNDGGDGWHMLVGGFRADSTLSTNDTLMLQGKLYDGREGTPTTDLPSVTTPAPVNIETQVNLAGGFLQGAWKHTYSSRSDTALQVSFDRYEREDVIHDTRDTVNIDFQHHIEWGERQNIVWGLEYLGSISNSHGSFYVSLVPADLKTSLYSSFIEDRVAVVPDRLYVSIGARLEHNHYSGFGFMPGAAIAWTPSSRQTLWASISQALRTPSAVDAGFRANVASFPGPGGLPVVVAFLGNPNLQDEGLIAYEAGYRTILLSSLTVDLAAFFDDYDHQETVEPGPLFPENTPSPPHLVAPFIFENLMHGEAHGFEAAVNWRVGSRWTLSPGYAFERIHMHLAPASRDTTTVSAEEGASPVHSAQLRSHVALGHGLTWDASAYFVDRLVNPSVPSYTRVDLGLSWKLGEAGTLSFVGQNLVRDHRVEFVDSTLTARTTQIKRSAYAKWTWRF
ncbi:MAG TPA: TonB-dependent receptor [Candidatus Acidoferrales bacterium]|nr:TonB-dependent receptor [Candidatus Acidoferrales bacterium]